MIGILKISASLALFICAANAVPLYEGADFGDFGSGCAGGACEQSVNSGSVQLGSSTTIFPETNVIPITRYQPYVKSYAPIIDSECDYPFGGYGGNGRYGGYGGYGGYIDYGNFELGSRGLSNLFKRQMDPSLQMQQQTQVAPDCVPSATVSCDIPLPQSNVEMGSQVGIVPSTQVMPQIFYQGAVQSLAANINAAAAEASVLPQESVNLGSNVDIQPVTQVLPQTFYQPVLNSLATDIQAAPAQDYNLPQSSATLGSTVGIVPVTTVRPLTVFQPSIQSLPFIINAQTNCEQGLSSGALLPGAAGAGAVPLNAAAAPGSAFRSTFGSSMASGIQLMGLQLVGNSLW
ncbi:hypothetical protein BGW42_000732 [Actinomortierella wolfii]|nr:hypothetical protein BGW42_000732 [Actinomortierella wolfii]